MYKDLHEFLCDSWDVVFCRYVFEGRLARGGQSLEDERRGFDQLTTLTVRFSHFLKRVVIKLLHYFVIRVNGYEVALRTRLRIVHFVKTLIMLMEEGKKERSEYRGPRTWTYTVKPNTPRLYTNLNTLIL